MLRAFFRFIRYAKPPNFCFSKVFGASDTDHGNLKTDHAGLFLDWLGLVDAFQEEK